MALEGQLPASLLASHRDKCGTCANKNRKTPKAQTKQETSLPQKRRLEKKKTL